MRMTRPDIYDKLREILAAHIIQDYEIYEIIDFIEDNFEQKQS